MSQISVTIDRYQIDTTNGKWRIKLLVHDKKNASKKYAFTNFIYDDEESAKLDADIAKWVLSPVMNGHPNKPNCVVEVAR